MPQVQPWKRQKDKKKKKKEKKRKEKKLEVPAVAQWVRDPMLLKLWCRLQARLGSSVVVALA